jgi:hypothetical protein
MAFVMGLRDSRKIFLRFYLNASMGNCWRGPVAACTFFTAVPRVLRYDKWKSAVPERREDAIRFHPTLLALAIISSHVQSRWPGATRRAGSSERSARYGTPSSPRARSPISMT